MERVNDWLNTEPVLQMETIFDIILIMTPIVMLAAYMLTCHHLEQRKLDKYINEQIYRAKHQCEFREEDGSEIKITR